MVVKRFCLLKIICIGLFVTIFLCGSIFPSFALSFNDVTEDVYFPYRMYYDNDNRELIALFNYSESNTNFGSLSPIGAGMRINGDTYTYFKLPYGCMLAGIIIYNSYSQSQGFYDSASWWEFFNDYITVDSNLSSAFDYVTQHMSIGLTLNNLKTIENVICKSSYNRDNYLVFSNLIIEFLYQYSYRILYDYGMFGSSFTYDQFYNESFHLVSLIDHCYDISRNPQTYKENLYSFNTSAGITSDYIPINNVFEEYLIGNTYDPISLIFALLTSPDTFHWLPDGFLDIVITATTMATGIILVLFILKMKGHAS